MNVLDPNSKLASLHVNVDGELLVAGISGGGSGGLSDTELRASPVPISGTVAVNVGLTDTQLRATPVPISGTVAVTGANTGTPKSFRVTVTRPNDTTAYAAGDTIANATSGAAVPVFTNVAAANGGAFRLERIVLHGNAIPSVVNLDLAIALFDTVLATPPNDNAPIDLTNTDNLTLVTLVPLFGQTNVFSLDVAGTGINGEHFLESDKLDRTLICAAGSRNLWMAMWVLNASGYTPVAQEAWTIDLIGYQL